MTSIKKTLLSAIIALMTVCSLLFGITLINSSVTARADEELTAADFAVAIAVRVKDDEHPNGGIRFKVRVEKSKFETLMTDGVLNEGVQTGVLVTSNAIAKTLEGGLIKANAEEAGVYDLDTTDYWEAITEDETDYYESVVAIYNVPTDRSNVKLAVMPYVVNGETTVYRNEAGVASMADAVLADEENGADFAETYIHTYTITYYDIAGEAIDGGSEEKQYGDTIAEEKVAAPEVTGYTFDAWKNEAGTTAWVFGENGTKVTGDTNLYAKYTINTYVVTFDTNGGNEIAAASVPYGTASSALDEIIPTKTGYTFVKWQLQTGEDTYVDIDGTETVTEDITVEAVWTANTYYVTFKNGEETVGEPVAYTVETASITEPDVPTKEGYTGAWETYDLTTVGGITVNAVYTPIVYTATIDRVSGDDEEVEFTIENRETVLLADITLTEDTAEWAYSWVEDLPEVLALNNTQVFTETRAKKTYQVLWNDYNGNNLETDSAVEYGDTPSYDGDEPTRTGYTFSAWSPAVTTVTGAATYVATYTANEYTLSFTGGDSAVDSITVTYDSALSSLPEVPERTGYYGVWKIDGTVVSSTDVWNYTTAKTADAVYCNLNNVTYEESVVYSFEYINADVEIYNYSTNAITALDVGGDYALKVTCNNVDGVPSVVVPAGRVSKRDIWEADIYVSENATILDYTSGNYGLNFKANNISLAAGWNHVTFVAQSTAKALIRLNLSKGDVFYVDNLKKIDINQDNITFEEGADIVLTNNASNERIVDSKYGLSFIGLSSVNLMKYNDLTIPTLPYGENYAGGGNYLIKYVPASSAAPSVRLNDRTIGDVYVMWVYIQSDTVSNLNLRENFTTIQMPNPLPNNNSDKSIPTNQWTPILIKITGSSVGFYFTNEVVANISAIYIDNIKKIGTLNDGGDITIDFEEGAYGAYISNGFSGSLYEYDGSITKNENGGKYALKLTGKGYYRITKNLVTENATWSIDIYVSGAEGTNYTLIQNGCTLSTTTVAANTWTTVTITCTPGTPGISLAGFGLTSGTFSAVYIDNLKTV